ncbi:nuclear transport factor 2 family protein, partial [Streptomyces sp. SID7803]|nr:nuclear transport factor 2 family protein [Streptomyces sp. SID7803]
MLAFRKAVEAHDLTAVEAALADDVVFTSPVAFKPYPGGKPVTAAILRAVTEVFGGDFRYVREMASPDGRDHALVFTRRSRPGDHR